MINDNIKQIMKIDVNNLAETQFNSLKKYTIEVLTEIIKAIKNDDFTTVRKHLRFSPAGGGCGCDNSFISFDVEYDKEWDIGDVINKLEQLQREVVK